MKSGMPIILLAMLFICNGCTRSLTITKEYRAENIVQSDFKYDVWSYGNWETTKTKWRWTHSYDPPYKLLLAIRPNETGWDEIEMLSANILHRNTILDLMPTLSDSVKKIELRPVAAIKEPYAVFQFSDAIPFNGPCTIEFEFRSTGLNAETHKQKLEIPYFETKQRGFVFWDNIMGI